MRRSQMNSHLPSHSWLFLNRLTNWFAIAFVVIAVLVFVIVNSITYSIRRNCNDPYHREMKIFGYWINITMGSTKESCTYIGTSR